MKKVVVADAGPLIGLGRIGHLSLLEQLYTTLLIPPKVHTELQLSTHRPGAKAVSDAIQVGWIQCVSLQNQNPLPGLIHIIDAGEVEAIQLSLEQHADFLIIDDKKGRRVAKERGVSVIGLGGILIAAKRAGFLSQVSPVLSALTENDYRLSPELCKHIITLAEE